MSEPSRGNGTDAAGAGRCPALQDPKVLAIVLAVSILAVYFPTLSHPFVFDDIPELVSSPDVLRFRDCQDTIFRSQNTGLSGRPVACLTFAANVAIGGFSVRGFHIVNIAIHILAALTLFGILRRTLDHVRGTEAGHSTVVAAGVIAALWALHPLQSESVTYIIQRIESLAGLFYLLTLYCAIRAVPRASFIWPVLSVLSCALGMLTKEIVATAPLVVYLYDQVFVRKSHAWRPRALHWALAVTWVVPVILISQSPRGGSAGFGLGVTALDYLRTQAQVIVHYLRLVFWPFPQAISYSDWPIVRTWSPAFVPGILVLAMLAATVLGVVRRQWWGFCGAWFFLILAPSSSIVPIVTEPAAERRMYLPLAGLIAVVVISATWSWQYFQSAANWTPCSRRVLAVVAGLTAVIACAAPTVARNAEYASAIRILSSTLEVRPGDELIRGALVEELVRDQRLDEARQIHGEGLARNPASHILYDNWARAMILVGRHEEAVEAFSRAIEILPNDPILLGGLGASLLETGRLEEAIVPLTEAVRLSPNNYTARTNLGVALARLGRVEEAIGEFRKAVESKPSLASAHYNLGSLLLYQGQKGEAIKHLQQAVSLRPGDEEFRRALQAALGQ